MNRRSFLKMLLVGAGSSLLAACQQVLGRNMPTSLPLESVQPPTLTNTLQPSPRPSDTPTIPTTTNTTIPTATSTSTSTPTPTPVGIYLLAPLDGAELPKLGRVSFLWEAFADATNYLLEITNPSGTVVPFKTENTEFALYIESLPWAGEYSWRVIAYDNTGGELASSLLWYFTKPKSSVAAPTDSSSGTGSRGVDPTPTDYGGPGSTISGSTSGPGDG